MNATTHQTSENWAEPSTTTGATAAHDSLADSLATADRARTTDPSTPSEGSTTPTEIPTAESTPAEAPPDEVEVPTRLPEPETTIYRDSTTVIRLLQTETMTDAVEVRLYRAADASVEAANASTPMATDGGRRESLDALPAATRERFETAVDAVAERFDLGVDDNGRLRARRDDHGRAGILEFAARLTDR